MNRDELKEEYGDEYPNAAVVDGVRLPRSRETPFTRIYSSEGSTTEHWISRFMDGSASMRFEELQTQWTSWPDGQRTDFCLSCGWLTDQPDFVQMLRFIMKNGLPSHWSNIALHIAHSLPRDEAFGFLLKALRDADITQGHCANFSQAIVYTKHPDSEAELRRHLERVWTHETLWNDDPFTNWVAFDAATCIQHLIEAGALASDFEEQVRELSEHPCAGNRETCRNYLSKHYAWLK